MKNLSKKYISWDTPPKEGEGFTLFTKKNRMIIMTSKRRFDETKDELLKDDELSGWLPNIVSNEPPPFLQVPMPAQKQIKD